MNKDAFVIMPFSATASCTEQRWTEIYENVFYPALESSGYHCERAKPMTGSLTGSIIDRLRCARVVLADLTDRNPNVFYELGIRHCLKKGTILVAQGSHHIPSDLMGYWFVDYGLMPAAVTKFRLEINRLTALIEADPEKADNPVADYLDKEHISIQGYLRRDALKKLGALCTELSGLQNILHEFSEQDLAAFITFDCLKLLCNTMYVDVGPKLLSEAYELVFALTRLNANSKDPYKIKNAHDHVCSFATKIWELRKNLARGEYTEPTEVSTMIWAPDPDPSCVMVCPHDAALRYSAIEFFSTTLQDSTKQSGS